jgi:DNA-binding transcriptional LysR family regulator
MTCACFWRWRAESLSGAGKVLKCDAATVGRRIARLEDAGRAAFCALPQGYALTDAGGRLVEHAEQAEQAMMAAAEDLGGAAGR